jgi:hypothetical protein
MRPASPSGVSGRLPRNALSRGLVRVRARAQRAKLDAALADGQDPWSSGAIMSRAAELSSLSTRTRLATSLEALVDFAELQPGSPLIRSCIVLLHREALLDLASRLRDMPPFEVKVVARLATLVWNQESPAFHAGDPPPRFSEVIASCIHVLRSGPQMRSRPHSR